MRSLLLVAAVLTASLAATAQSQTTESARLGCNGSLLGVSGPEQISVTQDAGGFVYSDSAGITNTCTTPACSTIDATTARCTAFVFIDTAGGDDRVDLSATDAVATPEGGTPTVNLGDGNDVVIGPRAGGIRLVGDAGNDTLTGGPGADDLSGGAGDDVETGGAGNDVVSSGEGADRADGGAGDDEVSGGDGDDPSVTGGPGDDRVYGGDGRDVLDGGDGDDLVFGYHDADAVDTVSCGAGRLDAVTASKPDSVTGGCELVVRDGQTLPVAERPDGRIDSAGRLTVRARCNLDCELFAFATVKIGRRTYRTRPAVGAEESLVPEVFRMAYPAAARKAIAARLRAGARLRATIEVQVLPRSQTIGERNGKRAVKRVRFSVRLRRA
jgi:Ca2+-binding RTX toxin-like protein